MYGENFGLDYYRQRHKELVQASERARESAASKPTVTPNRPAGVSGQGCTSGRWRLPACAACAAGQPAATSRRIISPESHLPCMARPGKPATHCPSGRRLAQAESGQRRRTWWQG